MASGWHTLDAFAVLLRFLLDMGPVKILSTRVWLSFAVRLPSRCHMPVARRRRAAQKLPRQLPPGIAHSYR